VKSATPPQHITAVLPTGFNPRAREGRDVRLTHEQWYEAKVSIHAPVKGATGAVRLPVLKPLVSIHAPVKGATADTICGAGGVGVSIHAPVKGATGLAIHRRP